MGEGCGGWFPQQHLDWRSSSLNYLSDPLNLGQPSTAPLDLSLGRNMVSANGTLPVYVMSEIPRPFADEPSQQPALFQSLPHFGSAPAMAGSNVLKEKITADPCEGCGEAIAAGAGRSRKRFLVFDHSGDQTTLIFSSSGVEAPLRGQYLWRPKPVEACNFKAQVPGGESDMNHLSGPVLTDEFDENRRSDAQSDMHEDTEELNALLYSDDDSDCTDDDEVTSTGHSPCVMTAHVHEDLPKGSTEEVASCVGPTKKRKMLDGGSADVPSLVDTATFLKRASGSHENEDDAESSCGNGVNPLGFLGSKRMRREKRMQGPASMLQSILPDVKEKDKASRRDKIRETVSILQSIVPDGKGKDTVMLLDEAISYLKCLKLKAKALGLGMRQ